MSFAPGPWVLEDAPGSLTRIITTAGDTVAEVDVDVPKGDPACNARLIVAAPELYDVLAYLCAEIKHRSTQKHLERCVGFAEAVLDKAGEEEKS